MSEPERHIRMGAQNAHEPAQLPARTTKSRRGNRGIMAQTRHAADRARRRHNISLTVPASGPAHTNTPEPKLATDPANPVHVVAPTPNTAQRHTTPQNTTQLTTPHCTTLLTMPHATTPITTPHGTTLLTHDTARTTTPQDTTPHGGTPRGTTRRTTPHGNAHTASIPAPAHTGAAEPPAPAPTPASALTQPAPAQQATTAPTQPASAQQATTAPAQPTTPAPAQPTTPAPPQPTTPAPTQPAKQHRVNQPHASAQPHALSAPATQPRVTQPHASAQPHAHQAQPAPAHPAPAQPTGPSDARDATPAAVEATYAAIRASIPESVTAGEAADAEGAARRRAARTMHTTFAKGKDDTLLRPLAIPKGPPAPPTGTFDPSIRYPAERLIDAIKSTAADLQQRNIDVPELLLANMVLGAITRERRPPPVHPQQQRGLCPVPSPLVPTAIDDIIRAAGYSAPLHDSIRYGIDLMDTMGAISTTAANAQDAEDNAAAIQAIFHQQCEKGEIIDCTRILSAIPGFPPRRIVPLTTRPKDSGGIRIIHDPSHGDGPNATSDVAALRPARMDSASAYGRRLWDLRRRLGPAAIIEQIVRDLKGAYTNIPVRPQDMLSYVFQIGGTMYVSTRALFGQKAPGFYMCAISSAMAHHVTQKCATKEIDIAIAAYVDDTACAAEKGPAMQTAEEELHSIIAECGFTRAPNKGTTPAIRATFLGYEFDTSTMRVIATPKRREAAITELRALANRNRAQRSDLWRILGIMSSMTFATPTLAAFNTHLISCLSSAGPHDDGNGAYYVAVPPMARRDARICADIIETTEGASLMPAHERLDTAPQVQRMRHAHTLSSHCKTRDSVSTAQRHNSTRACDGHTRPLPRKASHYPLLAR